MTINLVQEELHNLVKNLDYSLRINKSKYVLVCSDREGEGKSTFLAACIPLLADIYQKQILIYDCQNGEDLLEVSNKGMNDPFIKKSVFEGVDYLHQDDLTFLDTAVAEDKVALANAHFTEIAKDYDVVFINMKTLKRAEKTTLPALPIDGAILMRSKKGLSSTSKPITNELLDREIPILGLVWNEV